MNPTAQLLKQQIMQNEVILYMKGTPQFPMCGFSAKVAKILMSMNTKFKYVNVLENPEIRAELPIVSNWPTFPQLYINGELIGGCDIVSELFENNELYPLLNEAQALLADAPEFSSAM
jgi:monothiol glutaredoxin